MFSSKGVMYPTFPTIPTAYVFQKFANINWQMYGRTDGKHMGIDVGVVSGKPGASIYAVYSGVVVEAGYSDQGGYGRRVVIEHEFGSYQTLYAHLQTVLVKVGDAVMTGEKIGTMGGNVDDKQRGASGGTHLHFEVILPQAVVGSIRTSRGYCVDPIPFLLERYFPSPINAIKVTSIKGLRVRSKPSVTSESVRNLTLKEVVNVAEVLPGTVTEKWVRLWSLREEYCAITFDGLVNAELVAPLKSEGEPLPESEPVSDNAYQRGVNDTVEKFQTLINTLREGN